jgi:hypothetical protein
VLAIWQELPGAAPVPLATLAWHAHGTGPLYVFDLGHTDALAIDIGRELTAILLDALLQAAAHRNAPVAPEWRIRLRWSSAPQQGAKDGEGEHCDTRREDGYEREDDRAPSAQRQPGAGAQSADPEASWGHRRGDGPGQRDEAFFGCYLQAATIVKEDGGPEVGGSCAA